MRIAVLNGPNLNLLGQREPEVYGRTSLAEIEAMVRQAADSHGVQIDWFQTNHEGGMVEAVQGFYRDQFAGQGPTGDDERPFHAALRWCSRRLAVSTVTDASRQ